MNDLHGIPGPGSVRSNLANYISSETFEVNTQLRNSFEHSLRLLFSRRLFQVSQKRLCLRYFCHCCDLQKERLFFLLESGCAQKAHDLGLHCAPSSCIGGLLSQTMRRHLDLSFLGPPYFLVLGTHRSSSSYAFLYGSF